MSVLLVFPKSNMNTVEFGFYNATHPPLSICYLSAYLKKSDIVTSSIDLNYSEEKDLMEIVETKCIQLVCFSITTFTFDIAYNLAREIKQVKPHIKIVFGGMPLKLFKEKLVEGIVDVMVMGDGEETLLRLVKHYLYENGRLNEISNIIYYRGGQLVETPSGVYLENLDDLPFPDRECLDLTQYATVSGIRQCYIVTSRGCPFNCLFCLSGSMGNKVRLRSVENIIDEIKAVKKAYPFYNKFHFVDETLNISSTRFQNLCKALERENIKWSCMLRADDNLNDDILVLMKCSGLELFEIGIESGSQLVLDAIKKGTKVETIERVLKKSAELEIPVIGTVMVPHFCDTGETISETINFIKKMSESYSLIPFPIRTNIHPKSPYSKYSFEYRICVNQNDEVISTKYLSSEEISSALDTLKQLQVRGIIQNISHFSIVNELLTDTLPGQDISALIKNSPVVQNMVENAIKSKLNIR